MLSQSLQNQKIPIGVLIFFFSTLLIISCGENGLFGKKNEWPCDEGETKCMKIVQYGTLTPIENAEVYLRSYAGTEELPSQLQIQYTDANGNVQWPCEWAITDICAEAPGYWDECGYGYDINTTWIADEVYELIPQAWINLKVEDITPYTTEYRVVAYAHYENTEMVDSVGTHYYRDLIKYRGNFPDEITFATLAYDSELGYDTLVSSQTIPVVVEAFDTLEYVFQY